MLNPTKPKTTIIIGDGIIKLQIAKGVIDKNRTADYQLTRTIRQMLENNANAEDIVAYLTDRNLPADEITMNKLAQEILKNPPEQGYLTISNAVQWRLQYGRIVDLNENIEGIVTIISKSRK